MGDSEILYLIEILFRAVIIEAGVNPVKGIVIMLAKDYNLATQGVVMRTPIGGTYDDHS